MSFAQDSIIVQEDVTGPFGTISIPLIREGGTSGAVAVSIQVCWVRGCGIEGQKCMLEYFIVV